MKKILCLLPLLICLYTASFAQHKRIKTWSIASSLIGRSTSAIERTIKEYGYEDDREADVDGVTLKSFTDENTDDTFFFGTRSGSVIVVSYTIEDSDEVTQSVATAEYEKFIKEMMAAGYKLTKTTKEKLWESKYFHNNAKGQKVKIETLRRDGQFAIAEISIYKEDFDVDAK